MSKHDPEGEAGSQPRFFGRRKGKPLRQIGQTLIESLLPQISIAEPKDGEVLDPASLFSHSPRAIWLEVGFGGGEHLAWQGEQNPDVGLIGGEVFLNGIASLLGHLDRGNISNVRIFPEDVRRLFPAMPDACLERIFVLFPDPWPKKRHAERRFISPANLDQLARLLKDGAELRIGTDDAVYKEWAPAQMALRPEFELISEDPSVKPTDWPLTRYEAKAIEQGRAPIYLRYRRVPRA